MYSHYQAHSDSSAFLPLLSKKGAVVCLLHKRFGYELLTPADGHVPKTGAILCDYITNVVRPQDTVLDIGTGETAILAIHAAVVGASHVTALDVRSEAIRRAKINVKHNGLANIVTIRQAPIKLFRTNKEFDVIVSNPPQMPVAQSRSLHDDGGQDGRVIMSQIVTFARDHIKKNGWLLFNVFSYLNVTKRYNTSTTLFSELRSAGFRPHVLHRFVKSAIPGSYTRRNINWIHRQYPKFNFFQDIGGNPAYHVLIIGAQKII